MEKVCIDIIQFGSSVHSQEIDKLKNYKSKLFEVNNEYKQINPGVILHSPYGYDIDNIAKLIYKLPKTNNIKICITDYPIIRFVDEQKIANVKAEIFYDKIHSKAYSIYKIRTLSFDTVIISLFEIDEYLKSNNFTIINYILYAIYQQVVISNIDEKDGKTAEDLFFHIDTRNCLFDCHHSQKHFIYSLNKPSICEDCKNDLIKYGFSEKNIIFIEKELKNIKKPTYYWLTDKIKNYPIIALIITVLTTITINIISNLIFELLINQI